MSENNNIKYNDSIIKKRIIVDKKKRISRKVMTIYEMTAVIGKRAKMLEMGIETKLDVSDKLKKNYIKIAEMELNAHLIPFSIQRPIFIKGELVYEEYNLYDDPDDENVRCELIILKI